ncbi:MAG: NAD(P)-dependent oxidoreductase [Phycisphaeraceae bacterium]
MNVLITGAAGYLGHGLVQAFAGHHAMRLLDIVAYDGPVDHEMVIGSVADYATVVDAVTGMDALVIAHMAPRKPGAYDNPEQAFDINVKGTANLYAAALEAGIKRVSLISSIGVVQAQKKRGVFLSRDLPRLATDPYPLSKVCQEVIAEQYHAMHGIASAMIRPAYITDEDTMADKYGRVATEVNWQYIDRRDIGLAARLALDVDDLACEAFYTLGHPSAEKHADVAYTRDRLGWQPEHDFTKYPSTT